MNPEETNCVCTDCEAKESGFASSKDYRKAADFDLTLTVVVFLGVILILAFGISRL